MYLHAAVAVEAGDAEQVLVLAVHREYFPGLDVAQADRARRRATSGMTRKPDKTVYIHHTQMCAKAERKRMDEQREG